MEERSIHIMDFQLLDRLKTGDEAAFTELYERYHKRVYAYLLSFVKQPHLAEDIVHEVFMKLWEARERIAVTVSFSAYLYRISRNKAIDTLKKISVDEALRKEILRTLSPLVAGTDPDFRKSARFEALYRDALASLSPQRKKVFLLCKEQGWSYEEAALELGISRNTVKDHIVESMRFLRSYFARVIQIVVVATIFWR